MKFTVVWHPNVQDTLATTWLDATDRNAVTWAAAEIDRILAEKPLGVGKELKEGLRKLVIPPLAVLYTVQENDCLVDVEFLRRSRAFRGD